MEGSSVLGMMPVEMVGLVYLPLFGVVVCCTILIFKNGTYLSANVPSSSREVFFTAAITVEVVPG